VLLRKGEGGGGGGGDRFGIDCLVGGFWPAGSVQVVVQSWFGFTVVELDSVMRSFGWSALLLLLCIARSLILALCFHGSNTNNSFQLVSSYCTCLVQSRSFIVDGPNSNL